jgi:hypothetical protein
MSLPERESLAEDLLLLALDNERGTSHLKEKDLRGALAAATVMDLLLGGKIAAMDGQVIVVDRGAMPDPVRERALRCIGDATTRPPLSRCGDMIATGMPDIAQQLGEQLVARGALDRQSHHRLGLLPAEERFPERDGRIEQAIRSRLRAVALDGAKPDPRTAVLAALVAGYHLDGTLFNEEERPRGCAQLRDIALQMHQHSRGGASATASGVMANIQVAGATHVSGNALVDFMASDGVDAAFQFVGDVLPTLLGVVFELLDIL